ncbi:pilus assembly protein TadG-related protein [Paraburkholderia bannensis]|uniref:pilus assembly protein TadG-related protein n=1 Tax=Paraburkholderia bannensis TaxID=765414 RepID=UPI002ABDD2FB|nr:pilus assembly protein TadG-related protein [Paraburkholderia bannensis]
MSRYSGRHSRRARQRGAVSVMVALSLIVLLGFAALSIDIGYIAFSQRRLQAGTDAAAMAGAMDLWKSASATAFADAKAYAAGQGINTLPSGVTVTSTTVQGLALSTASVPLPASQAVSTYNGIQVTQQASVPLFFARIFGINTKTISATSKAGAGFGATPYNVMIVLDTTRSMATTTDSNCKNSSGVALTRLACAEAGALQLLTGLSLAGDNVGLMVFPPISPSSSGYSFSCSSTEPGVVSTGQNGYSAVGVSGSNATYQISPLGGGYLSGGALSTSSGVVQALGGASSKCGGISAPGGLGTFYAQAIASANAALTSFSQSQNPAGKNAIVLLSDGIATASTTQLGNVFGQSGGSKYVYGSECQAAINTAATAKSSGTTIYTVAYLGGEGASAPSCSDGSDALTACGTMQTIASNQSDFYSDTCTNASSTQSLNQIFAGIAYSLTKARLIPPSAT